MPLLSWVTAGESHGKGLTAVVSGVPAGLPLEEAHVNRDMARRQLGYGRGGRMKIEKDGVEFMAGVRAGLTLGSPLSMWVRNRDWENWENVMSPDPGAQTDRRTLTRPRPGHADLVGGIKYDQRDLRNVLERASARETAARVAVGGVARRLLEEFGVTIFSAVTQIGPESTDIDVAALDGSDAFDDSPLRCPDSEAEGRMVDFIKRCQKSGDTCGGVFTVVAKGLPVGLGSHTSWDRKLDGRVAAAMMSIQAMKGVAIGLGFDGAALPGSQAHDEIFYDNDRRSFYRETNRAGGLEGGITNGMPLVVHVAMKPISTLARALRSVDVNTKEPFTAQKERTDSCAVPAGGVVGEAMLAIVLAEAWLEKFGGDSLAEMRRNYESYQDYVRAV
ncbi:chorismate synthase [Candidatus Poribacteria bacterium]|jgi:chorismate synthase|nr:chorismate synthase [Candidatus Poribacteria bacterium]MBT5709814.1 chorismate synthase [Candidatus Poribacteria bacterium]MBT7806571.1 chorismate synthase [Candidatus Poribacteria bacterium]